MNELLFLLGLLFGCYVGFAVCDCYHESLAKGISEEIKKREQGK